MTTYGFIIGEAFRRVTGGTVGEYLRSEVAGPLGAEVHIGVPADQQPHRCADPVGKPTIREMLASAGAPKRPTKLSDHPQAGLAVAMGFAPDDEIATNDLTLWRQLEFPGTNGQVSALGLATFYNGLAGITVRPPSRSAFAASCASAVEGKSVNTSPWNVLNLRFAFKFFGRSEE